jgi:beta-lactam-binding protein with PASTA domain
MAKQQSCMVILFKMLLMIALLLGGIVALGFYVRDKLNEYFNRGENIVVPDFRGKHLVLVIKEKPSELIIETKDEKFDFRIPKDHVISQSPSPGTKVKPNKKVLLTVSLGSKQVLVPDLKDKDIRETGLALGNAQLREGNRTYLPYAKISSDRIITQFPLHPSTQEVSGNVDLLISAGAGEAKAPLPNFVGRSVEEVRGTLSSIDLIEGKVFSRNDPTRPTNQIIMTYPAPYSSVGKGEQIFFLVSAGAEKGNAGPADLKRFYAAEASVSSAPPSAGKEPAPPKIILPEDVVIANDDDEDDEDALAPDTPAVEDDSQGPGMTFLMPDGFLPKEVKFILQSPQGRQEIYSGIHKPNEQVHVNVPRLPGARVQIYINNVPVEERQVQ